MENSPRTQERGTGQSSLLPSPTSHSSTSSSTSSSNNNNNNALLLPSPRHHHHHSLSSPKQPVTTTRSESNPYPTTFVQADTTSFKQVVQMLTGSSEPQPQAQHQAQPKSTQHHHHQIPPIKTTQSKPKPSKLYERRNSLKNNLRINPLHHHLSSGSGFGSSPRNNHNEILSPSILDFPALVLSPVTPLIPDPFNRSPGPGVLVDKAAEEKAIAEKGFFLHPSPASTPRDSEPRLLPLFPLSSPRVSSSGSAHPSP